MSSERDDRDDSTAGGGEDSGGGAHGGGVHGGLAIGRTTGMGAGVAEGGTPGAGDTGVDVETGRDEPGGDDAKDDGHEGGG